MPRHLQGSITVSLDGDDCCLFYTPIGNEGSILNWIENLLILVVFMLEIVRILLRSSERPITVHQL